METIRLCPNCRKPLPTGAPQGICPECLLKAGMDTGVDLNADQPTDPATRFVPPSLADLAGLFPQLEILELLGRGGMGAVYKARQPALDRIVALKILPSRSSNDASFAERFTREARALARLNHPNIVAVYEFGQADGLSYFIMEHVDGVNLRRLQENNRLAPREALQIVSQICDALQYAHDEGVVHRDIKPENVLVDRKGRVKIADFGLAKIMSAEPEALRLTRDDQVMGTPHYMAPEQVEKPQTVDHRADIYSLGVVFYEMLTGELPLGKFAPPSRKAQIDLRLDDVVLHALEKDPERRYQQAGQVKTDLQTITTSARPPLTPAGASASPAAAPGDPARPVRLRDCWMWDKRIMWIVFLVPAAITAVLIPALYPLWGARALWFLAAPGGGLLFGVVYGFVGRQVRRLKEDLAAGDTRVAEALIATRTFESPGVVVLNTAQLEIRPIVGVPITIPLEDIKAVKQVRWFNGTFLWHKVGLILTLRNRKRIGIALPRPVAEDWKPTLTPPEPSPASATSARTTRAERAAQPSWVTAARWSARIAGALCIALLIPFVVAEGLPPLAQQPGAVQLSFAGGFLLLLGFIAGWGRDGTAAILIALGWTLFESAQNRVTLSPFHLVLLIAALYAACWWANHERRTVTVALVTALLIAAFLLGRWFLPASIFMHGRVVNAETGEPVANADLVVTSRRPGASNVRTGPDGKFSLYVGWYRPQAKLTISARDFATLATTLGRRPWGERRLERDYSLQPLEGNPGTADQTTEHLNVTLVAPVVIRTIPQSGSDDVDPALDEIRVTFSKPMEDGSWSWSTWSPETFPETAGAPHYLADRRTAVLPVKLKPDKSYALWINSDRFQNFQDQEGRSAVPYLLVFQTKHKYLTRTRRALIASTPVPNPTQAP